MGVFCRRWGVPLVDGGTVRLARLIGLSNALVYYTFLFIVIVIALFLFVNLKDSRSIWDFRHFVIYTKKILFVLFESWCACVMNMIKGLDFNWTWSHSEGSKRNGFSKSCCSWWTGHFQQSIKWVFYFHFCFFSLATQTLNFI